MKNFTIILSFLLCFLIGFQDIQAQSKTDPEALKRHDKIEAQNIAIIKKLYEELNTNRNVAVLDELYSPDYKFYSPSNILKPQNLEGVKKSFLWLFDAFPDSKYTIKNILADDDYVIVRTVFTGTHESDYFGMAAKGNKVDIGEITIYQIKDGKIIEERFEKDRKEFMTQAMNNIPEGWWKVGSVNESYIVGIDEEVSYKGAKSTFVVSLDKVINVHSGLGQNIDATPFIGKKIKMTGFVKSENIEGWAGLWLRIDGEKKDDGEKPEMLGFENMKDRPIKGTNDWAKYEIIMDVPVNSDKLFYGTVLIGKGKLWFDNISFEEITDDESKPIKIITEGPVNTSFEE